MLDVHAARCVSALPATAVVQLSVTTAKAAASRNAWTGRHLVQLRQAIKDLNLVMRKQREWLE